MIAAELSGWGRFPRAACRVHRPRSDAETAALLGAGAGTVIARGMGRAYGDSALNAGATIDMRARNRMLDFDVQTGRLTAEAGVVLGDVIEVFLPRGWFPAVTPGSKFVSLGGMIAADVHGKNHHRDGSFGRFVDWIDLLCPDGVVRRCSREAEAERFAHTLGGMGLTGIVLRTDVRLRAVESGWIRQETIACPDLAAVMAGFEAAEDSTYSVAWIDCLASGSRLGRSLLMLGEHARTDELPAGRDPFDVPRRRGRRVPVDFPGWALNRWSVRAFNELYYYRGRRADPVRLVDWDSYFYPLDAVREWNRIYGRRGFAQFQCVLPDAGARAGLTALLETTAAAGQASFLAVLKRFGAQESAFSFPMQGYTLAMDFPINRRTLALLEQLDAITLEHGGRFYLAKDSRMAPQTFARSEPRADAMRAFRAATGADARFASLQSDRLGL